MDMSDEPRKSIFRFRKKKDTQNLPKRGFWRGNLEAFTVATVLYMMVTLIVVTAMRFVESKVHIPGTIAMGSN